VSIFVSGGVRWRVSIINNVLSFGWECLIIWKRGPQDIRAFGDLGLHHSASLKGISCVRLSP